MELKNKLNKKKQNSTKFSKKINQKIAIKKIIPKKLNAYEENKNYVFFNDPIIKKIINRIMLRGNKAKAEKIFILLLLNFRKYKTFNTVDIIKLAIFSVRPYVGVTPVRKSGRIYLVPTILTKQQRILYAIKFIVRAARARQERFFITKLVNEFFDIIKERGNSIKMRHALESLAYINRTSLHYSYK